MVMARDARLTARSWEDAGLRALALSGSAALKAAPMAAALGVSRGSFYWHFADVEAFHRAVLRRWREVAYQDIVAAVDRVGGPDAAGPAVARQRLGRLMATAFRADGRLERAVRAWATAAPVAQAMVAAVDAHRLGYLRHLLRQAGLDEAAAARRARIVNWAWLGCVLAADRQDAAELAAVPEDLLDMAVPPAVVQ